ncbi:glucosaminidase domain-containing protein, partial [Lentzea aerocolonigenes]|uniref:glucosaminidase domain-containing protein n=1 Tax=Lentzea aerocolonigenes TaxID=68170 RepID=UPI0006964454
MTRRIIGASIAALLGLLVVATPAQADYRDDFLAAAGPAAQRVRADYDIPASVTVGQATLESNWGRSGLSVNDKNYFGFKCTSAGSPGPIAIGCHNYPTTECVPSPCHTVNAYFRVYRSMEDSFRDYGRLLTTSPTYADALPYRHDPDAFIRKVAPHYATDQSYADKVLTQMRTYNLYRFDSSEPVPAAGVGVAGGRTTWHAVGNTTQTFARGTDNKLIHKYLSDGM